MTVSPDKLREAADVLELLNEDQGSWIPNEYRRSPRSIREIADEIEEALKPKTTIKVEECRDELVVRVKVPGGWQSVCIGTGYSKGYITLTNTVDLGETIWSNE